MIKKMGSEAWGNETGSEAQMGANAWNNEESESEEDADSNVVGVGMVDYMKLKS